MSLVPPAGQWPIKNKRAAVKTRMSRGPLRGFRRPAAKKVGARPENGIIVCQHIFFAAGVSNRNQVKGAFDDEESAIARKSGGLDCPSVRREKPEIC